ncbi:hypothetical protein ACJIZ3_008370 [Penstemon smallii]|uniref:TCP domain-containing protein n=1 Tax=Penstemon smallii TaxID=265156 RepID=A0ABD3T9K2_9LAMI
MEVDEIQCKYPTITNGNGKLVTQAKKMDDEEDESERNKNNIVDISGGGVGRLYGWPSSRIVRVSRASGGKDRHSKVLTSKGLRDRRVRLSVNTAIQFYDLQDRLGYDQPSKAVEWLLKAAATSIAELPPFPETPKNDEKRSSNGDEQLGFESVEVDPNYPNQQQPNMTKSPDTSETSKGSGLSRSENRIKARERAKGRVAEKEKENECSPLLNKISHTTSFTELLSGGISNNVNNNGGGNEYFEKSTNPMDNYFSRANQLFSVTETEQQQYFSFVPDHNLRSRGNNNNLDFTISSSNNNNNNSSSSGLNGFNRGTLQSNSSMFPHLHRFNSPVVAEDGSPPPPPPSFFMGTTAPTVENHTQFMSRFDGRLHLCYGQRDGKEKN